MKVSFVLTVLLVVSFRAFSALAEARNEDIKRQLGTLDNDSLLLGYLIKYGYLSDNQIQNEQIVTNAIKKLQRYANIPESGVLDEKTVEFINKPRCGHPDFVKTTPRYSIQQPWSKRSLTYCIGYVNNRLTKAQVRTVFQNALSKWAQHVDLTFTEVLTILGCDIYAYFAFRIHSLNDNFDGPGGVLAHAFYPQNGDIHFDNSEKWTVTGPPGFDVFSVALHELGHSLGLDHSNVTDAVMYPIYSIWTNLTPDDIAGIQALYP